MKEFYEAGVRLAFFQAGITKTAANPSGIMTAFKVFLSEHPELLVGAGAGAGIGGLTGGIAGGNIQSALLGAGLGAGVGAGAGAVTRSGLGAMGRAAGGPAMSRFPG